MKLEILGTGCTKCRKLYDETVSAVKLAGVEAEVVKVEKIDEIMKRGVMMTPCLVIDGKVVSCGKVLKASEIAAMLGASND